MAILEHQDWVERRSGNGRSAALFLTSSGEALVAELLDARDSSLTRLLAPLRPHELTDMARAAEVVLAAQTDSRQDLERLCRLCHRTHCPNCPVATAAPN
jgi:DNA-binding MarR family transcriptional regulator